MDDQLQKIRETRSKRDALKTELRECQVSFEKNRKDQEDAILQGKDALGFETEISRLQIRIQGLGTVIKSIDETLKGLDEESAVRLRKEKIEQVEQSKLKCAETLADLYLRFSEDISKIGELKTTHTEYRLGLRAINQNDYFSQKVGNLLETLRKDIPNILEMFPVEIFAEGKLPKPEELKRLLKK